MRAEPIEIVCGGLDREGANMRALNVQCCFFEKFDEDGDGQIDLEGQISETRCLNVLKRSDSLLLCVFTRGLRAQCHGK